MLLCRMLRCFAASTKILGSQNVNFLSPSKVNLLSNRGIRNSFGAIERIMKKRRKIAGPELPRHRSEWLEWNYQAELFAFPKRLHEEISENTIKTAFTHQSYIDQEERKRQELGVPVQDVPINLTPNSSLITVGENIMVPYIKGFLRYCCQNLPEEGVCSICDYLMSVEVLSHVSSNIGTKDLILCSEFPVEPKTLAKTLKAVVGAIATDSNQERAELFVQDFVCTQLVGKDLMELWNIENPKDLLNTLLKRHGRVHFEARLVFESGRNTLEAVYLIGLYSNKEFLGQGYGETLAIAEEMAAYDSLARIFELTLSEKAFPFGKHGRHLKFNPEKENQALFEWYNVKFASIAQ